MNRTNPRSPSDMHAEESAPLPGPRTRERPASPDRVPVGLARLKRLAAFDRFGAAWKSRDSGSGAHPVATGAATQSVDASQTRSLRSLFVSDLHLGSGGSQAKAFLQFLRRTEAKTIYLVGDVFDIWHVGPIEWSAAHDAILSELAARAASGTRVVYLPGNHDAAMRKFFGIGEKFPIRGMFELKDQVTHVAADGRRYLVLHGDQCDARILKWHVLTRLGSRTEAALRRLDRALLQAIGSQARNGVLDLMRQGVSALLLARNDFERRLVQLARDCGHDGVICGHFHRAALRDHDGTTYVNCGDWVDSLTAVGEAEDGRLHLLEWKVRRPERPRVAPQEKEVIA